MIESLKDKLVDILVKGNLIKQKDLETALEMQKKAGGNLGKILIEKGYISPKDLMAVMSRQLNIPPIDLGKYKITKTIVQLIPERMAKQYALIPVSKIGNVLMVAMADPLNIFAIDDIKTLTNYQIEPLIATEDAIRDAINSYYGGGSAKDISKILEEAPQDAAFKDVADEMAEEDETLDVSEAIDASQSAPIVKIVSLILNEALKRRASDIHIEPYEKLLRVRYRIDGALREVLTIPKKNQNAVIARIKIMSKLDITETRAPQDGRFKINYEGKEIDFRVSVLPITYGGKVVMRILDKSALTIGLDKLGFLPGPLATFRTALTRPYGMLLVTGPTGSGKSTTLYSIITQLNTPDRNIITLEDPVEYEIEGITQMQAKSEIGLTFASGLKSVLRQSPDIVMVGEIRDFETADIAIKASLTGQLILSTLHTNDAAGALTRLIDMGAEPFLVASSLVLCSAQRLMRKLCPNCREEVVLPASVLAEAGLTAEQIKKRGAQPFYKAKGCVRCNNTGYFGRIAILEALLIDDKVREMVMRKAASDEIKRYAIASLGMTTLRDNALENLMLGTTTLEEVMRVTAED